MGGPRLLFQDSAAIRTAKPNGAERNQTMRGRSAEGVLDRSAERQPTAKPIPFAMTMYNAIRAPRRGAVTRGAAAGLCACNRKSPLAASGSRFQLRRKDMTTFDKREDSFEKKFAHDEELRFKARRGATRCWGYGRPRSSGRTAPTPTPIAARSSPPTSRSGRRGRLSKIAQATSSRRRTHLTIDPPHQDEMMSVAMRAVRADQIAASQSRKASFRR